MQLTAKQAEFWREPFHRWCIKSGATRSGKTWLDFYIIPRRIRECADKEGLIVMLGNTKGTLQRNIIEPMQKIYGTQLVSSIRSDNTARMFGQRVHCLGADNKKHMDRLRGSAIAYCYGDEIVTWSEDVFTMLKSRLDKPYSRFDGTCNPEGPTHWFKKFLESDADIFLQEYTLDDNTFQDPAVKAAIKQEYAGTVFYDRYVLGRWVAAEGVIYRPYADNAARFARIPEPSEIRMAWIGIDYGGNGSANTFSLVGTDARFENLYVLDEFYSKAKGTPNDLEQAFVDFLISARQKYRIMGIYGDSAEQTLIRGFNAALRQARLPFEVENARKGAIIDRIRFTLRMMGAGRFWVAPHCIHTAEALQTALWDAKTPNKDVRLDDGKQNVDSLDAMEYAFEHMMGDFIR